MQVHENKIVDLKACIKQRTVKQQRKQNGQYRCTMSGNRLAGFCEILIYDNIHNTAEVFQLYFSTKGLTEHRYLDAEEVQLWDKNKNDTVHITYRQALILLGDAVRQSYKYQRRVKWLQIYDSIHVQRVWQKEYYDYNSCSLDWLLDLQDIVQFITIYLAAIANKDAVLLYDLTASTMKQNISREVYAYSWNHVLEDFNIFNYEIVHVEHDLEENCWNLYVVLCGKYGERNLLSVDVCVKLIVENGRLYLLNEMVMDANHVSGY
ncbi:MAG: hypothetical protein II211_04005 [Peptococcaceae bacterium]|nr:hypothetical protein [Peptococcaceae bacterium]